ncbi:YchJ family protein [Labilibacter marinus]|uniref:YchJ family protein n=1 Tax=Labilibacter marinus TaxID=1477105 RepID=UPI00082BA291|nr:YchJ family metal-binding protein [Labilibacter marinus]
MLNSLCPCGSKKDKNNCCVAILEGKLEAETAEALMRSRYTAFTLAHAEYLMKSHHSKTRNIKDKKDIKQWAKSVKWMGLTIINTEKGQLGDDTGTVEFKALFIENGQLNHIHEKSFFCLENKKWVYKSGKQLP